MSFKQALFITIITFTYFTSNSMQKIERASNLVPFAGKIVAYTAKNPFFQNWPHRKPISGENEYGYVTHRASNWYSDSKGHEAGYGLSFLTKENLSSHSMALINSEIEKDELHMRKITKEEAILILEALKEGAMFCNQESNEMIALLQHKIQKQ